MKNYYYILGITNNADENAIRTAYKKLSMLFHPDRNGGDKFFEDRFKEIQEAYDTLSNSVKRSEYDEQMRSFFYTPQQQTTNASSFNSTPPNVYQFEASKKALSEGELLTLTWQTANADSVHLDPLGMVEANGTKTIRLPNMLNRPQLVLTLTATNTFIQKSSQRTLQIQNKSYRAVANLSGESNLPPKAEQQQTAPPKNSSPKTEQQTSSTPPPKTETITPPPQTESIESEPNANPTPPPLVNTGLAVLPRRQTPPPMSSSRMTDFQVYLIVAIMAVLMVVMASVVYQLNFAK